jgi:hypothetical protein
MSDSVSDALHVRLEQQRNWELAPAVRDGRQPAVDPDTHRLVEIRSGERVYEGAVGNFVKRLKGDAWRVESQLPDIYS